MNSSIETILIQCVHSLNEQFQKFQTILSSIQPRISETIMGTIVILGNNGDIDESEETHYWSSVLIGNDIVNSSYVPKTETTKGIHDLTYETVIIGSVNTAITNSRIHSVVNLILIGARDSDSKLEFNEIENKGSDIICIGNIYTRSYSEFTNQKITFLPSATHIGSIYEYELEHDYVIPGYSVSIGTRKFIMGLNTNNMVMIGAGAGNNANELASGSVFIGTSAGDAVEFTNPCICIGTSALSQCKNIGHCIGIGSSAGVGFISSASDVFICFGFNAFTNGVSKMLRDIFIGYKSGFEVQCDSSNIAIGANSMHNAVSERNNINIGYSCISECQSQKASNICIGSNIMNTQGCTQKSNNIVIGSQNFMTDSYQGDNSICIGPDNFMSNARQNDNGIVIGQNNYVQQSQGNYSIAIGHECVFSSNSAQNEKCIAIGTHCITGYTQPNLSIIIGSNCQSILTATQCIALGYNVSSLDIHGISIGSYANSKGQKSISIGHNAGTNPVSTSTIEKSICIGYNCGKTSSRAANGICIGANTSSGRTQKANSIAIGSNAYINQEPECIYLGSCKDVMDSTQNAGGIIVGSLNLNTGSQHSHGVILGTLNNQSLPATLNTSGIIIGSENFLDHQQEQGSYSLCLGSHVKSQKPQSIILHATSNEFSTPSDDSFESVGGLYVKPIRQFITQDEDESLWYEKLIVDSATSEILCIHNPTIPITGFYKNGLNIHNQFEGILDIYGTCDVTTANQDGEFICYTDFIHNNPSIFSESINNVQLAIDLSTGIIGYCID